MEKLNIALITTKMTAKYIFDCISESKINNIHTLDDVKKYLDDKILKINRDNFYLNILLNHYGKDHDFGEIEGSSDSIKNLIKHLNIYMINDCFGVEDLSKSNEVYDITLELLTTK